MANSIKGDVELPLGGEVFHLRPTFDAYRLIEQQLGVGSMIISARIVGKSYGVGDIAAIVQHGVAAAGEDSERALGLLLENGLLAALPACSRFMEITFRGTRDEEELEKNSDTPPSKPTE